MSYSVVELEQHFAQFRDPNTQCAYSEQAWVKLFEFKENILKIDLQLGYPIADYQTELTNLISEHMHAQFPQLQLDITLSHKICAHQVSTNLKGLEKIKNIIAIASGKGGVGKSTVTANLACALKNAGAKVGILDADIYGPSQPKMFARENVQPHATKNNIQPVDAHGIQTTSIGYLVEQDSAMIWRGPMVSGALQQLLNETNWDDLDYLLIDLPPGTGDIQLTLAQKVPVTAAIIVTTPQDIALLDARKAYSMFRKVNVEVLGVIENMAMFNCPNCNHQSHIFGEGGGQRMAKQYDIALLGQLPLAESIQRDCDVGLPTVLADPDSLGARTFVSAARKLAATLSLLPKNYAAKFPNIVVENIK